VASWHDEVHAKPQEGVVVVVEEEEA